MHGIPVDCLYLSIVTNTMDNLIPIRIDVTGDSYRLVDSVLIDPHVPIPNQLPFQLAADAQISNIVHRGRNQFANRLETKIESSKVHEQILAQLQQYRSQQLQQAKTEPSKETHEATEEAVEAPADPPNDAFSSEPPTKKQKTNNNKDQDIDTQPSSKTTQLIPVQLRLSMYGVRLHDDFLWDPSLEDVSFLQMAATLVQDLQLPVDCTNTIALAIAEQVYSNSGTKSRLNNTYTHPLLPEEGTPANLHENTTAAWTLAPSTYNTHLSHLVSHYRPTTGAS